MRLDPLPARPIRNPQLDRPPAEPPPGSADEEGLLSGARAARAFRQPRLQSAQRHAPDRHDARLAALAEHAHRSVATIDLLEIEPDDLREAKPGGVKQLHHRPIA